MAQVARAGDGLSAALGAAIGIVVVGIILAWRARRPHQVFVLALAAILGALCFNLPSLILTKPRLLAATINKRLKYPGTR